MMPVGLPQIQYHRTRGLGGGPPRAPHSIQLVKQPWGLLCRSFHHGSWWHRDHHRQSLAADREIGWWCFDGRFHFECTVPAEDGSPNHESMQSHRCSMKNPKHLPFVGDWNLHPTWIEQDPTKFQTLHLPHHQEWCNCEWCQASNCCSNSLREVLRKPPFWRWLHCVLHGGPFLHFDTKNVRHKRPPLIWDRLDRIARQNQNQNPDCDSGLLQSNQHLYIGRRRDRSLNDNQTRRYWCQSHQGSVEATDACG